MSATAGPAFGVDQLEHRGVRGAGADPGEPLVGHRRRAVDGGQRRGLRAPGHQAGRQVVGAGDHVGPSPAAAVETRRGAHLQRCAPTRRARPGRRPSTFASGSAPRMLTPSGRTRCRAARSGRPPRRRSAASRPAAVPCGSPRSGCRSSSASAATTRQHDRAGARRPRPAPHRRPPSRLAVGRRRAQHQRRPGSRAPAGRAARSAATTAARRGRRPTSGRSTCQARVLRSSALACTSPPVASSAAATSPSAGAGSTTYSMPRAASAVHGVRGRARRQPPHQRGEVAVLGGQGEHLVLADGDAVVATHGVASARPRREPRTTRIPCSGPSSELWTMYAGMPASRSLVERRRRRRARTSQPAERHRDGDRDEHATAADARGAHRAAMSRPSAPRTTAVTSAACDDDQEEAEARRRRTARPGRA